MKWFTIILVFVFGGCMNNLGNQNDSISIRSADNIKDCRICPGYTILTKGKHSDTLLSGHWGKPLSYKIHKVGNDSFLILDGELDFPHGHRFWQFEIYSLQNASYLKLVSRQLHTVYKEFWDGEELLETINGVKDVRFQKDTIRVFFEQTFLSHQKESTRKDVVFNQILLPVGVN
jgi:hypothetical protein